MQIIKIMNNSLVIAKDENEKEIIVMGKGIGFKRKPGEEINEEQIEKIFVLKNEVSTREYARLIEETPNEQIEIVSYIVKYANEKFNKNLNDQIFITLIDHISYAIKRYENNIIIQNRLLWEVKNFYPKEFEIGKHAVEYINKKLSINLPEEEAGNIAFHIVNAETEECEMENTLLVVKMLKDIYNIIQYNLKVKIDKDSLNYSRFIVHLQFFIQRLIDGKMNESKDTFIFEQIKKQYPEKVKCAKLIEEYIKELLGKEITNDELMYLTIHIIRLSENNNRYN